MFVPAAINADTLYGIDPSPANNYGLGASFVSVNTLAVAEQARSAAPSIWWLVAAVVFILVVVE
jgi:hypothetical protein